MIFLYVFLVCITHVHVAGLGQKNDTTSQLNLAKGSRRYLNKLFHFQSETLKDTVQLVKYYGFPCEVHTVTTDDGYILTLFRIPGNKIHGVDPSLPPALLVHGTLSFSGNFLTNTPENSFALLLAKKGFDVWLANMRGTQYSRRHKFLNPDSSAYWQFSWDEIATLDLPANIDHILNVTKHAQLYYSGHSMGGGIPFALCADKPEYKAKIKAIFSLAAMGNLANLTEIVHILLEFAPQIQFLVNLFKFYETPAVPRILGGLLGKYLEPIIREFVFYMVGPDYPEWNSSRAEVHAAHVISSFAVHVLIHEAQLMKAGEYKKYDWGASINQKRYGQKTPPFYDLTTVDVPTYLYYGTHDQFCSKANQQYLKDRLRNATMIQAGGTWNHMDFMWAQHAGDELYVDLVKLMLDFH